MHKIGFVVFPRFQLMGFAAVTALEMANLALGEPAYETELLSEAAARSSLPPASACSQKPSTTQPMIP